MLRMGGGARRAAAKLERMTKAQELAILNRETVACRKCPRLVRHREKVARAKHRAYRQWTYWGRPVPGFGDPVAELLLIGLAPGAPGANRTGRMFTGDRSGDFLYRLLHRAGFASQPASTHREDGLALRDAYITATVRCAPPGNKPKPAEIRNCLPYLQRELELLRPRAVLALGRIAFDSYLKVLLEQGTIASRAPFRFAHGASYQMTAVPSASAHRPAPGPSPVLPRLFASYHPSQQNTQTGRLTAAMFQRVLRAIRRFLEGAPRRSRPTR